MTDWYQGKSFLRIWLSVSILLACILGLIYYDKSENDLALLKSDQTSLVNLHLKSASDNLNNIQSDLMFVATHHELRRYLESSSRTIPEDLAHNLVSLSKTRGIYDQIRLLDEKGMEVLRINRNGGSPYRVPDRELQFKGDRYYFKEVMNLAGGEVYISVFDLNVENGKIERPFKPVIRVGTPICDAKGRQRGAIVLNYLGSALLDDLRKAHGREGEFMALNHEGYFLLAPNSKDEWGFMMKERRDRRFSKTFPDAWKRISASESGQFRSSDGLFTFATVYPALEVAKPGNEAKAAAPRPGMRGNHWKIVSRIPPEMIFQRLHDWRVGLMQVYVFLVLPAGVGSWVLAGANARRGEAEHILSKSAAEIEDLYNNAPCGYHSLDKDGVFIRINNTELSWLGYARDELIGRRFTDFLTPEGIRLFGENFPGFMERGWVRDLEFDLVRKDGFIIPVLLSATAIKDERGEFVMSRSTLFDISERKRIEDRLRERNEILERIFATTHFAIVYLDRDFNFIRVNKSYADSCGHPPEFFPGKNHFDLYPHEENEAIFRRVVESGEPFTIYAKPFEFPDHPEWGVTYWDWSLYPVLASDGSVEGLLFVLLDVTKHKKTELALQAGEERYRKQYWGVPVPTYTWTRQGDDFALTDYNQAAEVITQGGIANFMGNSLKAMFADRPDIIADTTACFAEKRQLRREFWYTMRSTGERRYLNVTYAFLPDDQVLVHTEDLTERKLAEEELARHRDHLEELVHERTADLEKEVEERRRTAKELKDSYDMVSDLLARIERTRDEEREKTVRDIHDDVGQLLTAISYDIAYLEKNLPDGAAKLRGVTGNTLSLVDKVVKRIQQIAAGLHPPLLDTLDIVAAMEWRAVEFEKETGISCTVTSKPSVIKLDKNLSHELFKIFSEALNNVARHSGATDVAVTMTKEEKKVCLEIHDNGRGFRPDMVHVRKVTGVAGMKARLRPWGGTLTIQSGEGEGTTVRASLVLGKRTREVSE